MKLIVGNWKMNGLEADTAERIGRLTAVQLKNALMVICPPFTLLSTVGRAIKGSPIILGAQNCHAQASGAFTGDISADMLRDQGCKYVIVGHSERRQFAKETSADVNAKALAVHKAGLTAIVCVGETDAERTDGKANAVVTEQIKASIPPGATAENTVIAYEPVWAIGTGKTASSDDIMQMHALIRSLAGPLQILYGGSVKGSNAVDILHLQNVDGVLVGGASLKADEFIDIFNAGT